ncbi:MAG: O-antigen ligase family protein [Fibrobacteria bacterium]|nr:O-antigen ligase family protein [Fibrobacteria bacterium]
MQISSHNNISETSTKAVPYINKQSLFFWVGIHIVLGLFIQKDSNFSTIWAYLALAYGIHAIQFKKKQNLAHFFAAYMVGLELILRMTRANIFWEYGKYSTILLLLMGLKTNPFNLRFNKSIFAYFLLLTPSIILSDPNVSGMALREMIASTLSGPALLCLATMYFNKTTMTLAEFTKTVLYLLLPLISALSFLIKNFYNLEDITFNMYSNYELSGGYGPNQVSTALGFGVILIFLCFLLKQSLFHKFYRDLAFFGLFLVFGLLTFSRGGVITAVISCFLLILYFQFSAKKRNLTERIFLMSILAIVIFFQLWRSLNSFTDGMLTQRYQVIAHTDVRFSFTGRQDIIKDDIEIFKDNFLLGVGPGMGRIARSHYSFGRQASAHTEFTRMLAEHGLLGLLSLFFMLTLPFQKFKEHKITDSKLVLIAFVSFSLLTVSHSSMRLALPAFVYGLAFVTLSSTQKTLSIKNLFSLK